MLRWAASASAALLLTSVVSLEPANADDQVTYSDFLNEVQKGNVEMVRVQNDMMTASYTSKDGGRHNVNLIPNASVEDDLFGKLADKKVDVVMQDVNAVVNAEATSTTSTTSMVLLSIDDFCMFK